MSQRIRTVVQDPNENLNYGIDWTRQLDGDTIATSNWVTTGLTASGSGSNTTVIATSPKLTAGTVGSDYEIENTITTTTGAFTIQGHILVQIR